MKGETPSVTPDIDAILALPHLEMIRGKDASPSGEPVERRSRVSWRVPVVGMITERSSQLLLPGWIFLVVRKAGCRRFGSSDCRKCLAQRTGGCHTQKQGLPQKRGYRLRGLVGLIDGPAPGGVHRNPAALVHFFCRTQHAWRGQRPQPRAGCRSHRGKPDRCLLAVCRIGNSKSSVSESRGLSKCARLVQTLADAWKFNPKKSLQPLMDTDEH